MNRNIYINKLQNTKIELKKGSDTKTKNKKDDPKKSL